MQVGKLFSVTGIMFWNKADRGDCGGDSKQGAKMISVIDTSMITGWSAKQIGG